MFCLCYPVIGGGLGDVANERGVALAKGYGRSLCLGYKRLEGV
jgi:hypothetical protein